MLTKKSEPLDWTEDDAIDLFAPEPTGSSRKSDVRAEPLQDFASEVLPSFSRSAVPFEPKRSSFPAALATAVVVAIVATALIVQRVGLAPSGAPAVPAAPIELPKVATTSKPPTAPPPPVVAETPSSPVAETPSSAVARTPSSPVDAGDRSAGDRSAPVTSTAKPPARAVPVTEPVRAPERRAAVVAPPPAVRVERPLSQDPGRLAARSVPSPRPSADAATTSTSPASTASPPPASPPPAVRVSEPAPVATPPPAATPPAAVTPPPAAAPPPVAAPPVPVASPPATASASPAASAPAPPPVAASAIESNTTGIRNTLARYQKAFSALDAGAARAVWPTVNEGTLNRAFERLEEQQISFNKCQIDVNEARAEATCQGTARYVPRVGSRTPRVDNRQWRFSLVKVREEWLIGAVDAR